MKTENIFRNILAYGSIVIGFSFLFAGFISNDITTNRLDLICGLLLLREGFDMLKTQTIIINS